MAGKIGAIKLQRSLVGFNLEFHFFSILRTSLPIRHEISIDITKKYNYTAPFHSEFHALQDNSNTLFALQIEFFNLIELNLYF